LASRGQSNRVAYPPPRESLGGCVVFQPLIDKGFQVAFHSHVEAILSVDFPDAVTVLQSVLLDLTIPIEEEIVGSGGGETKGTAKP
jgi:hypothetical protein